MFIKKRMHFKDKLLQSERNERKQETHKNIYYIHGAKYGCFFLCLFLFFSIMNVPVYADEAQKTQEKTIRTAFFDGSYIQKNEDGKKAAMVMNFSRRYHLIQAGNITT